MAIGKGTYGVVTNYGTAGLHVEKRVQLFVDGTVQTTTIKDVAYSTFVRQMGPRIGLMRYCGLTSEDTSGVFAIRQIKGEGDLLLLMANMKFEARMFVLAEVIEQLAVGLSTLHDHGVAHNDVKPNNIVFTGGPTSKAQLAAPETWLNRLRVYLIDGGSWVPMFDANTSEYNHMCTHHFAAPETFLHGSILTASHLDAYSLGAVIYFIIHGEFILGPPRESTRDTVSTTVVDEKVGNNNADNNVDRNSIGVFQEQHRLLASEGRFAAKYPPDAPPPDGVPCEIWTWMKALLKTDPRQRMTVSELCWWMRARSFAPHLSLLPRIKTTISPSLNLGDPFSLDFWAGDLRSRAIDLIAAHVHVDKGFSLAVNLADRLCVKIFRAPCLAEVMACACIARSIVDPKFATGGVGVKCDAASAAVIASVMSALEYNLYVHTAYAMLQVQRPGQAVDAWRMILATKVSSCGKAADIVGKYLATSTDSYSTYSTDAAGGSSAHDPTNTFRQQQQEQEQEQEQEQQQTRSPHDGDLRDCLSSNIARMCCNVA